MILIAGAVLGLIAVAFGAYVEHGLRDGLSEELFRSVMTAIRSNQIHAVVVAAIGLSLLQGPAVPGHGPLTWTGGSAGCPSALTRCSASRCRSAAPACPTWCWSRATPGRTRMPTTGRRACSPPGSRKTSRITPAQSPTESNPPGPSRPDSATVALTPAGHGGSAGPALARAFPRRLRLDRGPGTPGRARFANGCVGDMLCRSVNPPDRSAIVKVYQRGAWCRLHPTSPGLSLQTSFIIDHAYAVRSPAVPVPEYEVARCCVGTGREAGHDHTGDTVADEPARQ